MRRFYPRIGKRILDLTIAVPAATLLSLPVLAITFLIRCRLGKPVFFRQVRAGRHGQPFVLYKFRTMTEARDEDGRPLPDQLRLTQLGRFLRSTSLDELPGLINVLKGEMSLVGPRPLLLHYLPRYNPTQARRHDVLPGITGWAQIGGRNTISWEDRLHRDVWYVDHLSFGLDLKILGTTFWKTLRREGINQPGRATMDEFRGNTHVHQ